MKELNEYEVNTVSGGIFDLAAPTVGALFMGFATVDTACKVISIAATGIIVKSAIVVMAGLAATGGALGVSIGSGVSVGVVAAGSITAADVAIKTFAPK